jgi:hypothetical protein
MDVELSEDFLNFLDQRIEKLRITLYPMEQILKIHENDNLVDPEPPENLYYFCPVTEVDSVKKALHDTNFILHFPKEPANLNNTGSHGDSDPDERIFLHKYTLSYKDGSTIPIFYRKLLGLKFFVTRVDNQKAVYSCSMRNLVVMLNDLKKAEPQKKK